MSNERDMNKTYVSKHKTQLSTSYDFIYGCNSHSFKNDKDRFLNKNTMEFPNYTKQKSSNFIQKYNDYSFKPRKKSVDNTSNPFKLKNLSFYEDDFISESSKNKDFIKVIKELKTTPIDLRVFNYMKTHFNKVYSQNSLVPINTFRRIWRSLIGKQTAFRYPVIEQKLLHVLVNEEDNKAIDLDKLEQFVYVLEFLNIKVVKDKNQSHHVSYSLSHTSNVKMDHG